MIEQFVTDIEYSADAVTKVIRGEMSCHKFIKELLLFNSKSPLAIHSEYQLTIIKGCTPTQLDVQNFVRSGKIEFVYDDAWTKSMLIYRYDTEDCLMDAYEIPWYVQKDNGEFEPTFAKYIYDKYVLEENNLFKVVDETKARIKNIDTTALTNSFDKCAQRFAEIGARLRNADGTDVDAMASFNPKKKVIITCKDTTVDAETLDALCNVKENYATMSLDTNMATYMNYDTLTSIAASKVDASNIYMSDGTSLEDFYNQLFEECGFNENKNKESNEGDKTMNMMNFDFGAIRGDSVHLSMYGVAIKNKNGRWVSYDPKGQSVMDVEVFNFGGQNYLYKMPVGVADVKIGDVIVHSKVPMFVTGINKSEDGVVLSFKAIDPYEGEEKTILPLKNIFNFNFVTKIVSIMDGFGGFKADESNPFGNILPFMVFGDNDADIDPMMLMLMMNSQGDSNGINQNMMLALALNKEKGNSESLLPLMFMMNANKG